MTAEKAIRLLHPDTTADAIAEIKYYKGFTGKLAVVTAVAEACSMAVEALEKVEEYKRLEEQGLLLRLPCKVGDTVWTTKWWDIVQESVVVDGKKYFRNKDKHKVTKEKFSLYDYERIGKAVFLTREEAEKKLKELEECEF